MLHSGLGLFNARFATRLESGGMALFIDVVRLAARLGWRQSCDLHME
jgi:hypothetical protein